MNQTPDSCQETKFKVINLEEGALYRFRVMAVNAAGESDPTNLREPIRAQDRLGESLRFTSNIAVLGVTFIRQLHQKASVIVVWP